MLEKKITVFIPTYNKAKYITQTIESVLGQTYKNWEIVIIDDCSSDDTQDVVQKYLSETIRYFRHEVNYGPGATFNDGIEKARSEYVTMISSDDVLLPLHLEKVIEQFQDEEVETVFSRLKVINEHGKDLHQTIEPISSDKYKLLNYSFYIGNAMPSPGISYKKSFFTKTPAFNNALIQMHDYDLNIRSLIYGKTSSVTEPTVLYRRFSNPRINLSGDLKWIEFCHKAETKIVLDNYLHIGNSEMKKIFPILQNCNEEEVCFKFLLHSCTHKDERISSWGFERLVSYLENHPKLFRENHFDFQFKDYINLYKLHASGMVGTTHKQRLLNQIKKFIKMLFGLR